MITPELIERRLKNFWGYGSFDSPVWLIGMEEGLGPAADFNELGVRFRAADNKMITDMRHDMRELPEHMKWFQGKFPIQPTWKYPIALYLYLRYKKIPSRQQIREFQGLVLGDSKIKECSTIELMPLPSRDINESTWLYKEFDIPGLSTRKEYIEAHKSRRRKELKNLIEQHSPKLVIFYSLLYLPDWIEIIGNPPEKITEQMYFSKSSKTVFCILPQGVSYGMSYKRLYDFAEKIADKVLF